MDNVEYVFEHAKLESTQKRPENCATQKSGRFLHQRQTQIGPPQLRAI